jgi:hypothetical protein
MRWQYGAKKHTEEVLRSPVTLEFVIEMGARVEAGEGDQRDIFEENTQEPADDDEERVPDADEKQLKKLFTARGISPSCRCVGDKVRVMESENHAGRLSERGRRPGRRAPARPAARSLGP